MKQRTIFSADVLRIDAEKETEKICSRMRSLMVNHLKRRGIVIGLSGGIDSSVTAALAARCFGPQRVLGLEMPERHSADDTLEYSGMAAKAIGIETIREDISGILEAVGFYRRYDDAVRMMLPQYGTGWKSKLVSSDIFENHGFTLFSLVAQAPDGTIVKERLPLASYLQVVAATNFKQRIRKMLEYYHADRLN